MKNKERYVYMVVSESFSTVAGELAARLSGCGIQVRKNGRADDILQSVAVIAFIDENCNADIKQDINFISSCRIPFMAVVSNSDDIDDGILIQISLAVKGTVQNERLSDESFQALLNLIEKFEGDNTISEKKKKTLHAILLCSGIVLIAAAVIAVWSIKNMIWQSTDRENDSSVVSTVTEEKSPETVYDENTVKLDFSGMNLDVLPNLTGAVNLEELDLSGNHISDVSGLADFSELKKLNISGNPISDISVAVLLPKLEYLNIKGAPIENADILKLIPTLKVEQ